MLKVVPPQAPAFQPNLDAFEEMLTENVTCVLINTPNNPTGVVYSAETLTRLADILTEKEQGFRPQHLPRQRRALPRHRL